MYYQNQSAISSGLFTLLINRIGDCFFLVSLGILYAVSYDVRFSNTPYLNRRIVSTLLILTFITKRAIYPFSS